MTACSSSPGGNFAVLATLFFFPHRWRAYFSESRRLPGWEWYAPFISFQSAKANFLTSAIRVWKIVVVVIETCISAAHKHGVSYSPSRNNFLEDSKAPKMTYCRRRLCTRLVLRVPRCFSRVSSWVSIAMLSVDLRFLLFNSGMIQGFLYYICSVINEHTFGNRMLHCYTTVFHIVLK